MDAYFKISQLIAHSIAGTITPQDQLLLDHWLAQSPKNRAIYNNLLDKEQREKERATMDAFHQESAWQKIAPPKRTIHRRTFVKLTAYAASIAAVAVVTIMLFTGNKGTDGVAEILPGDYKAQLTLADGRIVDISDHQLEINEQGALIDNTDNTISYNTQEQEKKSALQKYNVLSTPKGGEYRLRLSDGSLVHLNAESSVRYPVAFSGSRREVELIGEAFFEVTENPKMPFVVKTNRGETTVLGTSFGIRAYQDEAVSYTTLVTGKIGFAYLGQSVLLTPGEQAVADNVGNVVKRHVDVWEYTGWKEGLYTFNQRSVEAIMKELGRWYDFDTCYENEQVKAIEFTGSLRRRENIEHFMQLLARTGEVSYKIEGRMITLY